MRKKKLQFIAIVIAINALFVNVCKSQDSLTSAGFYNGFYEQLADYDSLTNLLATDTLYPGRFFENDVFRLIKRVHELRSIYYPYADLKTALKADSISWAQKSTGSHNCDGDWQPVGPVGDPHAEGNPSSF